ncbi:MAG: hypothetical protein HOY71_51890 [Nonomuraea sp.]|nr:hypothetical protein [Nonomuraea sp.]
MTTVGIVGSGISGLTLALRLQQLGVEATLYAEDPGPRLPNTVARFVRTLAREKELGSLHFTEPGCLMTSATLSVKDVLEFTGYVDEPFHAVDFRLLLPALRADFAARGGRVVDVADSPGAAEVDAWSAAHELMVVAAGRRSVAELFPRDPSRSPYGGPQRKLLAGLYTGVDFGKTFSFNVSFGAGEILRWPMLTRHGIVSSILVEAVPGGPLEPVTRPDGPPLLALLDEHAPLLAERVDRSAVGLTGPDDVLRGALTPTVRAAVAELPSGRIAVAIGDAWITNDPLMGQGANLGSTCAWIAAESIARGGPYGLAFGRALERDMWRAAEPVVNWTNAFLRRPPDHMLELFLAAVVRQDLADLAISMFGDPVLAWELTSSRERVIDAIGADA